MYIVRGGIFAGTDFIELEGPEQRYGPYATYRDAFEKWAAETWKNVDICCHRMFIETL